MKKILNPANLPWFILTAGGLGIALRFWLLSNGVEPSGLLISGHPSDLLLWLLSAVTVAMAVFGCLPLTQANKYAFNFPPAIGGAVGEIALAIGILAASILTLPAFSDPLSAATVILGFLCVPALVFCAVCRYNGKQPPFLFHGLVSVFWILRLVSLYRVWSPEPQLQNYISPLLSHVFMMLSCYQRTSFDAGQGNRRSHAFTHLAAAFFCCLAIPGSQDWLLYCCCFLWAITDLCRLTPMPGWTLFPAKKDEDHDPA